MHIYSINAGGRQDMGLPFLRSVDDVITLAMSLK